MKTKASREKIAQTLEACNVLFDENGLNASEAMSVVTALFAYCIHGFALEKHTNGGLDVLFETLERLVQLQLTQMREEGLGNFKEEEARKDPTLQ